MSSRQFQLGDLAVVYSGNSNEWYVSVWNNGQWSNDRIVEIDSWFNGDYLPMGGEEDTAYFRPKNYARYFLKHHKNGREMER